MQPFRHKSTPSGAVGSMFDSSDVEKESHIGSATAARDARTASDNAVRDYEEKRAKLDNVVEQLQYLVADLKNVNRQQWTIRYPCLSGPSGSTESITSPSRPSVGPRRMTYADDASNPVDVIYSAVPTSRRTYRRTLTMAPSTASTSAVDSSSSFPPPEACLNQEPPPDEGFSILRLDLNLGAERQAKTLISRLEKASISSLLESRFDGTLEHLVSLRKRINDPHSRVLVTGDLNAGKSTLVNALLRRREIMPTDEQPLTTRFVEVINAAENDGVEEVHVWTSSEYDVNDKSTFTVESLDRLPELVADFDSDDTSPSVTVYLNNSDHISSTSASNPSILHNNVVDISLIDAPGLNRDSLKTTANFARQEEIDVVVFVVSAANHFTLSAKEFIWQAGHEKAHLFIVVNRFDQIKDKERCRRLVLDQIKHLSPDTYKDAADLVHFVDSAKVAFGLEDDDDANDIDEAFSHLEHSLRSFVLVNRSQSKLGPAQTYSLRLLSDIELLSSANSIVATKERDAARQEISNIKPSLDKMRKGKEAMEQDLLQEEEEAFNQASDRGRNLVLEGLTRIGRGELATSSSQLELPAYPGLLGIWDYARETRKALLASLDQVVQAAEDEARGITTQRVGLIEKIANDHLPENTPSSNRQFRPENMFIARRSSSPTAVGLSLQTQKLTEVQFSDIINLRAPLALVQHSAVTNSPSQEMIPFSSDVSSFGAASLAIGTLSLLNGKSKSLLDSLIRVIELASSPAAKRWAGPIVGAALIGATAYIIYDLPQSIPRNVGRQLQSQLLVSSELPGDLSGLPLPEAIGVHTSKEVRKVMRLGAWAVIDRHRSAMESRAQAMRESQATERRAMEALDHFQMVDRRVQAIRGIAENIKV